MVGRQWPTEQTIRQISHREHFSIGGSINPRIIARPATAQYTYRHRFLCGTHLFSVITSAGLRSVNGFMIPKGEFIPQFHVQCQHAAQASRKP